MGEPRNESSQSRCKPRNGQIAVGELTVRLAYKPLSRVMQPACTVLRDIWAAGVSQILCSLRKMSQLDSLTAETRRRVFG